jgi:hypothetical protein
MEIRSQKPLKKSKYIFRSPLFHLKYTFNILACAMTIYFYNFHSFFFQYQTWNTKWTEICLSITMISLFFFQSPSAIKRHWEIQWNEKKNHWSGFKMAIRFGFLNLFSRSWRSEWWNISYGQIRRSKFNL